MSKDPRVEYDRHEVLDLVTTTWREPASVWYLGWFAPKYTVPGRLPDGGDPADQPPPAPAPPKRSLLHRIGRGIGAALIAIPMGILWLLVRPNDDNPSTWGTGARRPMKWTKRLSGSITGGPDCLALSFADTARANPGRLWLAWSPSWLALVSSTGQSHVLWHCRGNARPAFDRERGRLVWPDGSVVSF